MKIDQYKLLEEKMVTYQQLKGVDVKECQDPFAILDNNEITNGYMLNRIDMIKQFGPQIIVRDLIKKKLKEAKEKLKIKRPDLELYVTDGYRSLEIQTDRFLKQLRSVATDFFEDPIDLYEEVHRFVAVPSVCGHPTGGAIDIVLRDKKTKYIIDFGSEIYNYSTKDCYVFAPNLSKKAKENRKLLRDLLLGFDFAPFDGEWWHFSYGDVEWAYYFKKERAVFEQKTSKYVLSNIRS